MKEIDVPVLVVGGRAGLSASMLLSQLGVETLLVSARPTPTWSKMHRVLPLPYATKPQIPK